MMPPVPSPPVPTAPPAVPPLPWLVPPGGAHGFCGDGVLQTALGEVCDDGNTKSGDGCSSDCKTVEKDYTCPHAGVPRTYLVRCGDGVLGGIEQCDPPHPGAGCAADCRLEPGYVCDLPLTPPAPSVSSTCHATVCGDGVKEGTEACDDGNTVDGDGCSSTCALEPDCSSGTCVSKCGDGLKLAPEACDDGNTVDGDGCTHDLSSGGRDSTAFSIARSRSTRARS